MGPITDISPQNLIFFTTHPHGVSWVWSLCLHNTTWAIAFSAQPPSLHGSVIIGYFVFYFTLIRVTHFSLAIFSSSDKQM